MRIAVIDLDSVAFTIGHPNKILDENGKPKRTEDDSKFLYIDKTENELCIAANETMNMIFNGGKFTHYIGFIKGVNTVDYKRTIDLNYKNDRSKDSPKWWSFVKNYLISNFGAIQVDNIEVDDAVNITRLNIKDSYICCIDGDLLGLEGTHYNWRNFKWITTSKEEANYNFWSDIISGTHNNTKGIPKKGNGFCLKLFNDAYTNYHYLSRTYKEFIKYFKERGKEEFIKNYICCKTLCEYKDFVIPIPIEIIKEDYNLIE